MQHHETLFNRMAETAGHFFNYYKQASLDMARLESAKIRLQALQGLRKVFLGYAALLVFNGLIFLTIIMFHVFLFLVIPNKIHAALALFLGDAFLVLAAGAFIFSEINWMKHFQCEEWYHQYRRALRHQFKRSHL